MLLLKFAIKVLLRSIFLVSTYIASLKSQRKLGVSVHLIEQSCCEVDLFAFKSGFCVICLILIYILQYFMMTTNVVIFYMYIYLKSENNTYY